MLAVPVMVAAQEEFNWKRFEGESIRLHGSNHPWMSALLPYLPEFVEKTGINVSYDLFAEQQMRQRLTVALQTQSSEIDVYMSLKSREGLLYRNAGWYADLQPFVDDPTMTSPDFDFAGFSKAALDGEYIKDQLTGLPLNVEGPIMYYRKDLLEQYGLKVPETLEELEATAKKLDEVLPENIVAFTSRGLKAAIAYTFSTFFHNMGAEWVVDGKSAMSSEAGVKALDLYTRLIRDYGPPGVINYTFYQISNLMAEKGTALTYHSSNEFGKVLTPYEERGEADLFGVAELPSGPGGQHSTVIGWGISMSAFSENKGPAWFFLQWATSPEMQTRMALKGIAPPRPSIWESGEFKTWLAEVPVRQQWAETLISMMENGTSAIAPPVENQPKVRDIIGDAVQQVLLGNMTPEEAAKQADEQVNTLLQN
jgi:multiple sugar transport system substrate-binding protein